VNEVGYPNNNSPETLNILKMCLDLTNLNEMEGYFYINDVKILVDIIIRELTNMSTPEDVSNAVDEIDLTLISKIEGNKIKKIRRQSLEIIAEVINELHSEMFNTEEDI
jgi:hypothetical protein